MHITNKSMLINSMTRKLFSWPIAAVLAMVSVSALAVEPFMADYQASYKGISGTGRMTLASAGGNRWTYSLNISGAGANLTQSTVFEDRNGQWRPLSNTDSTSWLIMKNNKNATYDWARGEARWSGDVKDDRAGPVKLQPGDLDAMLVNLAIARDVATGKTLDYRMVDNGRAKQMSYQIAGKEEISIGGKPQQATKLVSTDGNKQYIVWVVDGLPMPARIVERKNGRDDIDLRIKSVH